MGHYTSKDLEFKLDNSSASLTDLHAYMNNASVQHALNLLEDSALGDEERSYTPGLAGATLPINGFMNSTTEGIFGPLVGNRTSLTKTFALYNGVKWLTGEAWPGDVQITGAVDAIELWSCTLTLDGAITRTSAEPS